MGKEIERKWMLKPEVDYRDLIQDCGCKEIKDYYFNRYCRLRHCDGEWLITIKSEGTLIRDEFEFQLAKKQLDFLPAPMLVKKRYYKPEKSGYFEINVFDNLFITPEINPKPLIIVEKEMSNENENIELPDYLGYEITNFPMFYGYELFNKVKQSII